MKLLDQQSVLDAIPTNWLDNLLTGPDAVLIGNGGTWGCPDIERLLKTIRARLAALPTLEQCDVCNGLVDSTADACRHCG